jgi:hypothetical protein
VGINLKLVISRSSTPLGLAGGDIGHPWNPIGIGVPPERPPAPPPAVFHLGQQYRWPFLTPDARNTESIRTAGFEDAEGDKDALAASGELVST